MRLIILFYLLLLFFSNPNAANLNTHPAAPLLKYSVGGSGNHYPYFTNDPNTPGILAEIIVDVLSQANIKGINVEQPAKRTVQYIESGLIDFDTISPSWLSESEKNDKRFVFSEPLIAVDEYVVTRPDFQSVQPLLSGQLVGTVRGYYYHDDEHFERADFASERELLLALKMGRIDRIIIGELPALYWSKHLDVDISLNSLHSSGLLHIRLLAKHAELLPLLNKAIAQLRESGRLKEIEQRYIKTLPTIPATSH